MLIAGGEPDGDNPDDVEVTRKLAERTLKRYRIIDACWRAADRCSRLRPPGFTDGPPLVMLGLPGIGYAIPVGWDC